MSIQVGDQAPEFSLYDTGKKEVFLTDFRGKNVVVLFFPFAFSSVCTAEMCSVRDGLANFQKLNAQVIAISVDSLYTLAKFKTEFQLDFIFLSDFNKQVSSLYEALHEKFSYGMKGVSKRAAFVIDTIGNLRYAEVLENPGEQPQFGKIYQVLQTLT